MDNPFDNAPLHGLVLAGGQSRRMGVDKGLLLWQGKSLRQWAAERLAMVCHNVRLSLRHDQAADGPWPVLHDRYPDSGPMGALATAFDDASVDWLILPVDVPLLRPATLARLMLARREHQGAELILLRNPGRDRPENLVGIWTREAHSHVYAALRDGRLAIGELVDDMIVAEVPVQDSWELLNANDPETWSNAKERE